jgi:hypothetical protein
MSEPFVITFCMNILSHTAGGKKILAPRNKMIFFPLKPDPEVMKKMNSALSHKNNPDQLARFRVSHQAGTGISNRG